MGFCGFCGVPKLPLRDNSADGTAIAALRLDTSLRRSFSIFFCWLLVVFFQHLTEFQSFCGVTVMISTTPGLASAEPCSSRSALREGLAQEL